MNTLENIERLLRLCKKHQGEYIPGHHPRTSFATTYSNDFAEASFELYIVLRQHLFQQSALDEILHLFTQHGIRSCRTNVMDKRMVKYLYDAYWRDRLKRLPHERRKSLMGHFG